MRLKLVLAYDGTAYSGWQIQEKPQPPPTIQGAVETALFLLAGHKIRLFGAGRTDAGTHAHAQVAHCDVPDNTRSRNRDWRHSLNAILPPDIRILEARPVDADFHARNDAISKTYIYQFWLEPAFIPPAWRRYAWASGPLDLARMRPCLPHFLGEHDFSSFRNTGTNVASTLRHILAIHLEECPQVEFMPPHTPPLRLVVTADGFLKQMVRNIAGFLAAVGKNRLDASRLGAIFAARDRRALPSPTAPAHGLALARVEYGA